MRFKKLFQVLVLGGAVVGASSGCVPAANAQGKDKKRRQRSDSTGWRRPSPASMVPRRCRR